jgi:hypothetical protein
VDQVVVVAIFSQEQLELLDKVTVAEPLHLHSMVAVVAVPVAQVKQEVLLPAPAVSEV